MSKPYLVDRIMHWVSALVILFMLMNMYSQIHTVDYQVKGQLEHRQEAIELHGAVGIFLLILLLGRLIWFKMFREEIPRQSIVKKSHNMFIKITHFLLYLAVALLSVTGFLMATNADVPITAWGINLSSGVAQDVPFYGDVRDIHLSLITAFWWLIGIHFVGAIYARK